MVLDDAFASSIYRFIDANISFPVNVEYISSLKPVLSSYKPLPLLQRVE